MHNQRSYKTNLEYEATVSSQALSEKCKSFNPGSKGQTTLRLNEFPTIRVQITDHGYVKMHGGTAQDDEAILRALAPFVKTRDSKVFSWMLSKYTLGDRELLTRLAFETYRRVRKGDRRGVDMKYYLDVLRPIALRQDKQGIPLHPPHEGADYTHSVYECPSPEKYRSSNASHRGRRG